MTAVLHVFSPPILFIFLVSVNNSQVKKYMSNPALTFIPSNKAIKSNGALEKLKLADMVKYVGFHAVLFPKGKAPIGPKALLALPAGTQLKTQEGGVITKVGRRPFCRSARQVHDHTWKHKNSTSVEPTRNTSH